MKQLPDETPTHDFGQLMLALREATGLTQAGLSELLGVSRHTVGSWEQGSKFPSVEHLKHFVAIVHAHQAFTPGRAADEIRRLWRAAHRRIVLDEEWLAALLALPAKVPNAAAAPPAVPAAAPIDPARQPLINLPYQPTSFVGRAAEKSALAGILSNPHCRLLTLVGPGGIGKTRLAVEVAAEQAGRFADGVVFVALAPLTAASIVAAIGDALGLPGAPADRREQLLAHLRGRDMLVLLDNFEHLLAGVDLIYDIMQAAPRVTIIVTSRERLDLQAEWLFDVEGLAYPPESGLRGGLSRGPIDPAAFGAMQLFIERARQLQAGLTLSSADLEAVERIARHVAGMPLAIELAAANVRFLPIVEIERQLRSSLIVLSTNQRDVPPRHRSMNAAFDQSWNLLPDSERLLLGRLAVFRGGCTAAAATAVAGATPAALTALVDKSLLRIASAPPEQAALAQDGGPFELRYQLFEPVREYALEKLTAREDLAALQRRHGEYYLNLAETVAAGWDDPPAGELIARLEREYDNIRAVLIWARDGGDSTIGNQLAAALRSYWQRRGLAGDGGRRLDELLAPAATGSNEVNAAAQAARAAALQAADWLAADQHDYSGRS